MNLTEKEVEIYNEYLETLQNLTFNTKPLIDVLTEVADENKEYAKIIVMCIEDQLEKASIDLKLPILYLIDSIIKCDPIRQYYMHLFCKKLYWIFAKVYKEGKDEVRSRLSKLRFTWNGVIPLEFLTSLDNEVRKINPSWQTTPPVHVNPKFVPRISSSATLATNSSSAENVTKLSIASNTAATEEELQQKRSELLALKQRKEELEQELKLLRPKHDIKSDDKTERLSAIANQLFSQVEKLKTCSYKPAEIQKVRESAAVIKNSIIKSLDNISKEQIPSNPKLAALAKGTSILKDLIKKLTETEKVLAETEKVNQGKRKVIMDQNHFISPKIAVTSSVVIAPSCSVNTRPTFSSRTWSSKNFTNPYVYTKPALNVSSGTSVVPQNPPTFRIAPVSSQLINAAAARRVRDPRLRKIEQQDSKPRNSSTIVNKTKSSPSAQVEANKDKRNVKKPSSSMNLSEQLEAVMNATAAESSSQLSLTDENVSGTTSDVDIQLSLRNRLDTNVLPISAPTEIISTSLTNTTTTDVVSFNNPFGICETVTTKDIDYRKLFSFPLPSSLPSWTVEPTEDMKKNDPVIEIDTDINDVDMNCVNEQNFGKRKYDDKSDDKGKRRRTTSESSADSDQSKINFDTRQEKQYYETSKYSDSDNETNDKAYHGIDEIKKKNDMNEPPAWAGKVDIIINEEHRFPVFLNAKPQNIFVNGVPFVLMFIDALKKVLINDVPFNTEFGKMAQSFKFKNKIYYFRFTALPAGIVPGVVNISQMVMTKLPSPPPLPPSLQYTALNSNNDDFPLLPVSSAPMTSVPTKPNISNIPCMTVSGNQSNENDLRVLPDVASTDTKPQTSLNILENVNIDELFQKLVASGIVPSSNSTSVVNSNKNNNQDDFEDNIIKFVDLVKPETLKQKQPNLIKKLYSGMQCGSCGLRFPNEQTLKYSQHLDWHFRQNRRGKDGARMIHSRKWYYNYSDWMKFQEMEDNTDRGQSWFESHAITEPIEEVKKEVPCVSAGKNVQEAVCELCRDKLEQFYNEDIEEWQLRNAIRIDEQVYHPLCFQDHKKKETDTEETVDLEERITIDTQAEDDDDDSDIEEVQLIEQPIEEIIINDDINDLEPNLETLNVEDIVAAQQEVEQISVETDEKEEAEIIDKIVDITHGSQIASIDGNVEVGDSPQVISGSTKIKINIVKTHVEEKVLSPKTEENKIENNNEKVNESSDDVIQPLPPGEELIAAGKKERLKDRKLTDYPPVIKGTELSGLCSIM